MLSYIFFFNLEIFEHLIVIYVDVEYVTSFLGLGSLVNDGRRDLGRGCHELIIVP